MDNYLIPGTSGNIGQYVVNELVTLKKCRTNNS